MNTAPGLQKIVPRAASADGRALTVEKQRTGGSVHLRLSGELDAFSSDLLTRSMQAEEQQGCDEVIVDLENLLFIDSTGLRTLIEAASRAQGGGWTISVVNARGKVRLVFDLTDMDSVLDYWQKNPLRSEY